jgi:hypothetical protein
VLKRAGVHGHDPEVQYQRWMSLIHRALVKPARDLSLFKA